MSTTSIASRGMRNTGTFARLVPLMLVVWAWVLMWYWPTARQMANIWWRSDTYAHGLLVLPIFAWMVWRRRDWLELQTLQPSAWGVLGVAVFAALWLLAQWISVDGLAHFALICVLVWSMIAVLGWRIARGLSFPLAFLFFGLPIGEFLLPTLMHYTAEFTVAALRWSGVPVYQEGLFFIVPNGSWSVVEACSGLRYLVASLFVGTLYAYLHYRRPLRRLGFIAFSLVVPVVANWLRAYLIVLVGYLSDNRIAAGVDHLIYGWLFFGVVIFLMFWIGSFWREAPATQAEAGGADTRIDLPVRTAGPGGSAWIWVSWACVSAAFPLWAVWNAHEVAPFQVQLEAPAANAGWAWDEGAVLGYQPNYRGHRGSLYQTYRRSRDGVRVGLYVAYYAEQQAETEMVAWHNRLLDGPAGRGWVLVRSERSQLRGQPVQQVRLNRAEDGGQLFLWHWYWSDRRQLVSDLQAKWYLALDRLTGRADDAAFVALYVDERDVARITVGSQSELSAARAVAEEFIAAHGAALEAMLISRERRD